MNRNIQQTLSQGLSKLPPPQRLAYSAASASAIIFMLAKIRRNYREWLSIGAGGLPNNFIGFILNWTIYLIANTDTKSTGCYEPSHSKAPYDDRAQRSFLDEPLTTRGGPTPEVPNFVVPSRQTTQLSSPAIRDMQRRAFHELAEKYKDQIQIKQSKQERRGDAFWLTESALAQIPPWARGTKGEVAHLHLEADGSGHCTLSLKDAKEVLEKGWGQRHMLSGQKIGVFGFGRRWLSHSFVMVYAPRTEEEVKVQMRVFEAAVKCLSGQETKAQ